MNFQLSKKCYFFVLFHVMASWLMAFEDIPKKLNDIKAGLIVVISSQDKNVAQVAIGLAKEGNSLVHVIASNYAEVKEINAVISKSKVKGFVSVENLPYTNLPYRDYMVNALIVLNSKKATELGFNIKEAQRCLVPAGHLVYCKNGAFDKLKIMPLQKNMDVWTHRYYKANGIPASQDQFFDLPLGFKWNAGLPMNFDNPLQSANRYSSTRALVVDDGRCFTFSAAVYENLGQGYQSKYGADQYLTCRDAFNGRFLWRKRIGGTFYGGLYIENTAPLVSSGDYLYLAGENGKMLKLATRTGATVQEISTEYIPGLIACFDDVIVTATWKEGKKLGAEKRYDRRRMDWAIETGTIEAYDNKTSKLLWKENLLGTSLLIDAGRVVIINRDGKDDLELNHRKKKKGSDLKHPLNRVMAFDLKTGKLLWKTEASEIGLKDNTLNLESMTSDIIAIATSNRRRVTLISAVTGKLIKEEGLSVAQKNFFRFRNHVCTPVFHVKDIKLSHRGKIEKAGKRTTFGGARSACLTGTVPAYGAGYIAQNWCNCTPGQISGLIAVAGIGRELKPEEMEKAKSPVFYGKLPEQNDSEMTSLNWKTARANSQRSSSSPCDIKEVVNEAWSNKICSPVKEGTLEKDWRSFLNSRLTAPVLSKSLVIVGDINHNEIIAVNKQDGQVKWRTLLGGRIDTAPTVYKGLCLVGDHMGYVSAFDLLSGQLIYKLQIAPQEKRMVSYGKVESVWPVIGGVLVEGDKAYATAGRSQGSDGGLVVRSFDPLTGVQLWAKCIPQWGNGKKTSKIKLNDTLIYDKGLIRVMEHCLQADTGEFVEDPVNVLLKEARKKKATELGNQLNRTERKLVDVEILTSDKGKKFSAGNEGFVSWNWTRLGFRKFGSLSYGGLKGNTLSWNDQFKIVSITGRRSQLVLQEAGAKNKWIPLPKKSQGTSIVLCNNMIIEGGSLIDNENEKGFIRAISLESKKIIWEKRYPAQLAFNGLAIDQGQIFATFNDGTLLKIE